MGFYMPTDSGEKVTLGITSLLSTTVFLMLVAEGMPPTSEALPLIGIYYGVTIMLVALGTAMTVFTVNIHHTGVHGYPVPPFLQIFAFRYLSKLLFVRIEPYHSIAHHVRHMYQKEHPNECTLSAGVHYNRLKDFETSQVKKEEQCGLQRDSSNLSVISANVHCNPDDRLLLSTRFPKTSETDKMLRSSLSIKSGSPTAKKKGHVRVSNIPRSTRIMETDVSHLVTENNAFCDCCFCYDAPIFRFAYNDKVSFSSLNSHETPIDSPIYGRKLGRTQSQTPSSSHRNSNGNGGISEAPPPPPKISLTDVDDVFENEQQPIVDEFEKEFLRVMSMVHGIIERNEMRVAERDKRDAIALEWQQVAMVLDRFLLVVFLIGTSMSTFVILNQRSLFESTG
uniref:Neur_chan_memb domain-containing protein n=1 Tax=Caenorhabditis tropicalis TaxID=1561998 RepID=A0A1I7UP28_9PELO